jgi:hypothetical protein
MTNTTTTETSDILEPGTKVTLPDGETGTAYPYRQVGIRWDRETYRVATPSIFPGRVRVDLFPRSMLTPL